MSNEIVYSDQGVTVTFETILEGANGTVWDGKYIVRDTTATSPTQQTFYLKANAIMEANRIVNAK